MLARLAAGSILEDVVPDARPSCEVTNLLRLVRVVDTQLGTVFAPAIMHRQEHEDGLPPCDLLVGDNLEDVSDDGHGSGIGTRGEEALCGNSSIRVKEPCG